MMTEPIKVKLERQSILTHGINAKDKLVLDVEYFRQFHQRTEELFVNYGVEKDDWKSLAFKLAAKYEPSFQIKVVADDKEQTRPISWTPIMYLYLWWDVEEYILDHTHRGKKPTIDSAVGHLEDDEFWKGLFLSKDIGRLSRQSYNNAKNSPLVKTIINVEKALGRNEVRKLLSEFLENRENYILEFHQAINIKM
jgi:hypothetical protein